MLQYEDVDFVTLLQDQDHPRLLIDIKQLESKVDPYGTTHVIPITLINEFDVQASVNFKLNIIKKVIEAPAQLQKLSVRIMSMSLRGELVLQFSPKIDARPFQGNLSHFNSSLLDISVVPSKEHASREDFNSSKLNLTW